VSVWAGEVPATIEARIEALPATIEALTQR